MDKRRISIILSICLILAFMIALPGYAESVGQQDVEEPVQIKIICTSDIHGKILPYDYALDAPDDSGSLAQISSAVNELADQNTILIDVGDTFQGNSSEQFFGDREHPAVRAQKLMNYDVWVPGNHEFDFGMDILDKMIGQYDCNVLCANVFYKDGRSLGKPYAIVERAGVKIGIIGVVTQGITIWDKMVLEKGEMTVTDPVEEVSRYAKELRDQVDVLIAACHMGLGGVIGAEDSGAAKLAETVPELDLILASHGHKKEEKVINGVLVTENLDSGKTANVVTLTLGKKDGSYSLTGRENEFIMAADYPADSRITEDALIREADARSKEYANQVVARLSNASLVPEDEIPGIPQSKLQDTALIHLINDAQMHYSGCRISGSALHSGSANLLQGDIKRKDFSNVFRFQNTLYQLRMTGGQIKKWMEYSAGFFNTWQEGDLTVSFDPVFKPYNYVMFSGLKYEVDLSQPVGSRIRNLTLEDGSSLDPDEKYDVVTNNYLASIFLLTKGSVFGEEDELPELVQIDVGGSVGSVRDMIMDYVMNVIGVKGQDGIAEFTVEDITEENANWKLVGCSWDERKHARVAELVKNGRIQIDDYLDSYGNIIRPVTEDDLAVAEAEEAAEESVTAAEEAMTAEAETAASGLNVQAA